MSMLETPLELASHSNQWETMKVLLKDPRVNIDNRDIHGRGFLFWTSDKNHIESVQLVLATRPDIIVQDRDIPDMSNESEDLLKSYQLDPESTRDGLLTRLGYIERFSAELFALIVYLSDEYLAPQITIKPGIVNINRIKRFISIAERLPLDLQTESWKFKGCHSIQRFRGWIP